jgi:hypothetical protein
MTPLPITKKLKILNSTTPQLITFQLLLHRYETGSYPSSFGRSMEG